MGLFHMIVTLVTIVYICKTAESKMTIEQIKNTMKPYKTKCVKVTGIDLAVVDASTNGDWSTDKKLMCFIKCIFNMAKIIKEDDVSLKAIFAAVDLTVPDELVPRMKEILEDCVRMANEKVKDPNDLCEKSYLTAKCLQQTDSSLYFFP